MIVHVILQTTAAIFSLVVWSTTNQWRSSLIRQLAVVLVCWIAMVLAFWGGGGLAFAICVAFLLTLLIPELNDHKSRIWLRKIAAWTAGTLS